MSGGIPWPVLTTASWSRELGYDDDCDEALRAAVVAATGSELR